MRKREAGFTLIELVVTLLLVGILSVFAGLFMTTYVNGYFMVRNNSATALKAQMALDRISLELKDATAISVLTDNSLITYTNSLGANRTIRFVAPNIFLSTPANQILIDQVQGFTLTAPTGNVYNVDANDVAFIDIGFTVSGYNPFNTRIFPRTRIPHP
jgi:prepilin-type N-terminal cleavage/methylation domain-containing protein